MKVNADCPGCARPGIDMRSDLVDEPYFGEVLYTVLKCEHCGFRHTTSVIMHQGAPMRTSFTLSQTDDLAVRVVRANSATIHVPGLGVTIEPTSISESFVSNVDGILARVEDILKRVLVLADDEAQRQKAAELMERILKARSGELTLEIILDDPFGNSDIVSEKSERRALTPQEVETLSTGVHVFDVER
jgi:zinc finger protein